MRTLNLTLVALAAALTGGACAPKLVVQHDDPFGPAVEVSIDTNRAVRVEPGTTLRRRIRPGARHLDVSVIGDTDPYGLPPAGWNLVIDGPVTLTLFDAGADDDAR